MPDWWSWTALAVGLLVVCALAPVVGLIIRRRWLSGRGRVFACSLRVPPGGWVLGLARFRDEDLEWYRVFSLSLRPKHVFHRNGTQVVRVRQPDAAEASELYDGHVVTELGGDHAGWLLAMARPDLTAFSSWTEAGAPGGPGGSFRG
ncbi:MAG: DUF2550 domain-containing protein [Propionibacteriaceae bacterium]|nr:DUF2550 domain-containing protein [Propionibacteriaceae bacterium]